MINYFRNQATNVKGFIARSVLPLNATIYSGDIPSWHNSTVFPELKWKGDTSSDEGNK